MHYLVLDCETCVCISKADSWKFSKGWVSLLDKNLCSVLRELHFKQVTQTGWFPGWFAISFISPFWLLCCKTKVKILTQYVSPLKKKKSFSLGYSITSLSLNLLTVQLSLIFMLFFVWLWSWWDQFSFQLIFLVLLYLFSLLWYARKDLPGNT